MPKPQKTMTRRFLPLYQGYGTKDTAEQQAIGRPSQNRSHRAYIGGCLKNFVKVEEGQTLWITASTRKIDHPEAFKIRRKIMVTGQSRGIKVQHHKGYQNLTYSMKDYIKYHFGSQWTKLWVLVEIETEPAK